MVRLSHSWKQLVCQCTSNCAGPHITCTDNRKVSIGPPKICHRKHATLYRCCITLVIGKTKPYMLMEIHKSSHHIPKISLRNSLSNPTCWAWTFKYPTPFCILQHCKKQANHHATPQLRPWLGKHGTTLQMLQIKSCSDTVWKAWQGEIQPQNKFIGLWFSTLFELVLQSNFILTSLHHMDNFGTPCSTSSCHFCFQLPHLVTSKSRTNYWTGHKGSYIGLLGTRAILVQVVLLCSIIPLVATMLEEALNKYNIFIIIENVFILLM